MTFWQPWTIVLRGRFSQMESPITFLRFWTRWGAQRWLDRWNSSARWMSPESLRTWNDRLLDAEVQRVDRVERG